MKRIIFALIILIFIYPNKKLYAQNKKITDSLINIISNPKTADTTLIKAYNDLGVQYAPIDSKKAKVYINKALTLAKSSGRMRGVAGAQNCMGVVYYYKKEYDSAMIWFKKALATNKELGHQWGQASALHQIGVIYRIKTKYKEAIESFKESGNVFKILKDSVSLAKSYESIGSCYALMRYLDKSFEYFMMGMEICEKRNDSIGIGRGYAHIAYVLMNQDDYPKAVGYLHKALTVTEKSNNEYEISSLLFLLGRCYNKIEQYDKALEYAIKCLEYRKLSGNSKLIAPTRILIGSIYSNLKRYPESLKYMNKALNDYSFDGYYVGKTDAYNIIADVYLNVERLDSAKYYAQNAVNLSKQINYLSGENEGNSILARVSEKEDNKDMAFKYYKEAVRLKDSIYNKEKQEYVDELRTIYETEQKEKQIELQEIKISLLEEQVTVNKLQRILFFSGFGFIILGAGVWFYIAQQKIKNSKLIAKHSLLEKEKADEKLAFKTRELTSFAMHLEKKNKALDHLKKTINASLQGSESNMEMISKYEHLLKVIDEEIKDRENWEDFKKYFEQVHQGFYAKVKKEYPNLTSGDLRFMTLLKMNLSYKEISNILNITPQGVKKARQRLRKKLNLKPEDSLIDSVVRL
ncbi:tetratricopeptide repeat protein [Abyssalbus ytuae]|uniref:Tetratricopeptide repeat protein n=1 Tax=Abyssalbus ytuae TaxID=2926907 RepID=A0A9E6ZJF9_9FLAO|nr:tetratricopeptide repeat protein [Abyssalbus ytuae]UOB16694.1 tetratricopeptide repeat protein [Abyssalbus ytuae]